MVLFLSCMYIKHQLCWYQLMQPVVSLKGRLSVTSKSLYIPTVELMGCATFQPLNAFSDARSFCLRHWDATIICHCLSSSGVQSNLDLKLYFAMHDKHIQNVRNTTVSNWYACLKPYTSPSILISTSCMQSLRRFVASVFTSIYRLIVSLDFIIVYASISLIGCLLFIPQLWYCLSRTGTGHMS